MTPACVALRIEKGATFRDTMRIMQPSLFYRPITQVAPTAPVWLTIPGHGLPSTWLAWIDGVQGMPEPEPRSTSATASPGRVHRRQHRRDQPAVSRWAGACGRATDLPATC